MKLFIIHPLDDSVLNAMKNSTKSKVKKIVCNLPFVRQLVAYKTRHLPRIFMYHRFSAEHCGPGASLSVENFEWQLKRLRGKWNVISLAEYVQLRRQNRKIPPYTVILTIDDGYLDFYDLAFPLLQKYNFPATFFVTTAFIDGAFWLWHDRLHYAVEHTEITDVEISLGKKKVTLHTTTVSERSETWLLLSDYCVDAIDDDKWKLIASVEEILQVAIPEKPTDDFAAASWVQLKEMAGNSIEIGGHSMTHPILSQVDPETLQNELVNSKDIISRNTGYEVSSFCYPNGRDADVTPLVLKTVEDAGYLGAVQGFSLDFSNRYRLPRLGISNDRIDFLWKLNGFEQTFLKQ